MNSIKVMQKFLAAALVFISFNCFSQPEESGSRLKQYFFVLLTKGEHRDQDSATSAKIQEAHIRNIERLYKEGKIDIAGPFMEEGDWRGIFVFNVESKDGVETLLKTDEAIRSG